MANDRSEDTENEDKEGESAVSETEASGSTGSITEEPPEEGATGAAEPSEAAGPQSQGDPSDLEGEPDTDLDADPDAGLDDNNASGTDEGSVTHAGDDSSSTGSDPDPSDHGLEHTRKNDADGDREGGDGGEDLVERVSEHPAVQEVRQSDATDAIEQIRQSEATDAVDTSDPIVLAAVGSVLFSWYQFYVRGDREYGLFVGLWAPTLLAFADYLQNADVAETVQKFRSS